MYVAHIILLTGSGDGDLSFFISKMGVTVGPILQVYVRDEVVTRVSQGSGPVPGT